MSEHRKEPWRTGESLGTRSSIECTPIYASDGNMIGSAFDAPDARRIVACVNACAGIETEVLEQHHIGVISAESSARMRSVEQQRDELLETLKEMLAPHEGECRFDHNGYCQEHFLDHYMDGCRVANARAAIAKVEKAK